MTNIELDKLTAGHVMGGHVYHDGRCNTVVMFDANLDTERVMVIEEGHPWGCVDSDGWFNPSSKAESSDMVLDRMQALGWNWIVRWKGDQIRPLDGLYSCEFWRGADQEYGDRHITKHLAIVMAALKAFGVEVEA